MRYLLWGVCHVLAIMGYIYVLIRLFRHAGSLRGLLGVLIAPYTFVWGWLNHRRYELTPVMIVWSITFVVATIFDIAWLV